jgi:hypothetical protein
MSPARKDKDSNLVDFSYPERDPAVSALLTAAERRQAESRLPKQERTRKQKERRRQQERKAKRINLDLPVELKHRLMAMAENEGVPVSQLVAFLLIVPLREMEDERNPLWGYKIPSKCAKFDWVIDLEKRLNEKK